ncbi:MAG TPA: DUF4231 domain-containing protein [Chitinophagaceae bacterium]|nr:DUF4231 domain-containing protein [Chitinophagaceae bacterium]
MKQEPLVDKARLESIVDKLKSDLTANQIEFIKTRWLGQVVYWDQRSRRARRKYFAMRATMVLGGVALPVFTTLAITYPAQNTFFSILATFLGAIVAAAAAWEGIANYGQIWLEKRRAAELLKVEGWLFFELADRYSATSYAEGFKSFAGAVENLIGKEIGEYVAVFDTSATKKQFEKLLDNAVDRYLSGKKDATVTPPQ